MANTNFWTSTAADRVDPKRGFRFKVSIAGIQDDIIWYAKKADKPSPSISEASHQYLNHTYYWPARTEWNEVKITFVDPVEPNLGATMADLLEATGYKIPNATNADSDFASPSKSKSVGALGAVQIEQIDENGAALETWTLNNAWIKELTFGDLDYGSDDILEMTMKLRYDWASFEPITGPTRVGTNSTIFAVGNEP